MIKNLFLGGILLFTLACKNSESPTQSQKEIFSTIENQNFEISEWEKVVSEKYKDYQISDGLVWKDKNGKFTLLQLIYPTKTQKDPENPDMEVSHTEALTLLFDEKKNLISADKIVESAPLDVQALYLKNVSLVSDADSNGIGEAMVFVKHATRGDISPSTLTLLIFTEGKIYRKTGSMLLTLKPDSPMSKDYPNGIGGEIDDKGLKGAHNKIVDFANQLYASNYKEDFEKHFQ